MLWVFLPFGFKRVSCLLLHVLDALAEGDDGVPRRPPRGGRHDTGRSAERGGRTCAGVPALNHLNNYHLHLHAMAGAMVP